MTEMQNALSDERLTQIVCDFTDLSGRPGDWSPATKGEIANSLLELQRLRRGAREYITLEGITEQSVMDALTDENEVLVRLLERCRTVLGNMAAENEPVIAFGFQRWKINHEPLRADAKNLVAIIDAEATVGKASLQEGSAERR